MLSELSLRRVVLLIVGGLLIFSCGGSNPGAGTQTLFVKAQAISDGSTDGSWLAVEVRQGTSDGQVITDAVVTVRGDKTGEFNLPWDGIMLGNFKAGANRRSQLTWDTGWTLSVKRGADSLDAYLEAPGVSTIMTPIAGTTFKRADAKPLVITWKDDANRRAQVVELKLDHADQASVTLAEDTLEHQVDANRLVATDKEKVQLKRRNEIQLAGGVPGSLFSATTEHQIEFVVE